MDTPLRWGILGTGNIARRFATELQASRTGRLVAVGSRSPEGAERFAGHCRVSRAHGSYEALLADPEVDVVYISTPHPSHAEWSIKAARAGKHILCEKPMTMNATEAVSVLEAVRAHDVFFMEAFMYRCHPQTARLLEVIRSGAIGQVRLIRANFSFNAPVELEGRLFAHALGGGGILDVGCYCASMARLIAGACAGKPFQNPIRLNGVGRIGEATRVDEFAIASLEFPGGILAQLAAGIGVNLENNVRITGTEGAVLVPAPWVQPTGPAFSKILLFKEGIPEEIVVEFDRGQFAIEADVVAEFLAQRQAPAMSWEDSLGNMQTLDQWRQEIGMVYDWEK